MPIEFSFKAKFITLFTKAQASYSWLSVDSLLYTPNRTVASVGTRDSNADNAVLYVPRPSSGLQ